MSNTSQAASESRTMNADENGEVHGYMCRIDWEYELGAASDGDRVYPSLKALQHHRKCVSECGIVEVAVRLVRVVEEGE